MEVLQGDELSSRLASWGIPLSRIPDRSQRLTTLQVTQDSLAWVDPAVLAQVLAGEARVTIADTFDASVITSRAKAAAQGAIECGWSWVACC